MAIGDAQLVKSLLSRLLSLMVVVFGDKILAAAGDVGHVHIGLKGEASHFGRICAEVLGMDDGVRSQMDLSRRFLICIMGQHCFNCFVQLDKIYA